MPFFGSGPRLRVARSVRAFSTSAAVHSRTATPLRSRVLAPTIFPVLTQYSRTDLGMPVSLATSTEGTLTATGMETTLTPRTRRAEEMNELVNQGQRDVVQGIILCSSCTSVLLPIKSAFAHRSNMGFNHAS
jgi:hypothetical protein